MEWTASCQGLVGDDADGTFNILARWVAVRILIVSCDFVEKGLIGIQVYLGD
jgi:hypothetical protein